MPILLHSSSIVLLTTDAVLITIEISYIYHNSRFATNDSERCLSLGCCRQNFPASTRDQEIVLNTHSSDPHEALEHMLVDVFRVNR